MKSKSFLGFVCVLVLAFTVSLANAYEQPTNADNLSYINEQEQIAVTFVVDYTVVDAHKEAIKKFDAILNQYYTAPQGVYNVVKHVDGFVSVAIDVERRGRAPPGNSKLNLPRNKINYKSPV